MTSFKYMMVGAIFLAMLSIRVRGQQAAQPPLKPIHCPPLEMPVSVESFVQVDTLPRVDSTLLRKELSSVYARMQGHWYLFQIQGGWSGPKLPYRKVNITIDGLGNAVIADEDKPLAVFRIKLRKIWNAYYSPIEGRKQKFFTGMLRELVIEVCGDTLVLNEYLGDGQEYVFKR